jgi:deazaflavin-dependent oxidoreductase (nitroreductase family)
MTDRPPADAATDPRTRIGPPPWLKRLNDDLLARQRAGALPFDLPVLTVAGRRSGLPRRTPLTVLERDGRRYLLGGFPAAEWIRNVRAAGGRGVLTTGATDEEVRLVELGADEARPVLRAWHAAAPDGVGMMRDAGVVAGTAPDDLEAVAGVCPVFRVDPVRDPGPLDPAATVTATTDGQGA